MFGLIVSNVCLEFTRQVLNFDLDIIIIWPQKRQRREDFRSKGLLREKWHVAIQ